MLRVSRTIPGVLDTPTGGSGARGMPVRGGKTRFVQDVVSVITQSQLLDSHSIRSQTVTMVVALYYGMVSMRRETIGDD